MNYNIERLMEGCKDLSMDLSEKQINQFIKYYDFLIETNKVMNLTTITDFDDVVTKHFIDSLCCTKILDLSQRKRVIDVGTGAGFPGIPLKIAFPHLEICLLDSLNKRVHFLQQVIKMLELTDIYAVHGRAEEFARNKKYREAFDLCVSRAVANLSTLSEYCIPFVKKGGCFVAYKSGNIIEELESADHAIHILGGLVDHVEFFKLNNTDMDRSLILIRKEKSTPGKFPRKAGTPQREPIQ